MEQKKSVLEILFLTSRPRYWVYLLGAYSIGILTGISNTTIWNNTSTLFIFTFAVYFLFPANLLVYGINDLYDTDTDSLNPKKEQYETTIKSEDRDILMKVIFIVTCFFFCVSLFSPRSALSVFIIFIYTSVFYAAWPIRAKVRPFLDTIISALIYMTPALIGYYLVGGTHISIFVLLIGFIWAIAMHMQRAVVDIGADTEARIQTIATVLGRKKTHLVCLFLYGSIGVLSYITIGILGPVLTLPYIFLLFFSYRMKTYEKQFAVYTYIPRVTAIVLLCIIVFLALKNF
jgi:4-hydroxybenzoate polyprenyltransferase